MSLWTPDGEVPVDRGGGRPAASPNSAHARSPRADEGVTGIAGGPSLDDLSPEEREQAEAMIAQMADVQRQIASTPAAHLVANHVMGLYELGAIKLAQEPPMFADAQLAIDAMTALLDALGNRLGDDSEPLRQGLTQLQLAFVQLKNPPHE